MTDNIILLPKKNWWDFRFSRREYEYIFVMLSWPWRWRQWGPHRSIFTTRRKISEDNYIHEHYWNFWYRIEFSTFFPRQPVAWSCLHSTRDTYTVDVLGDTTLGCRQNPPSFRAIIKDCYHIFANTFYSHIDVVCNNVTLNTYIFTLTNLLNCVGNNEIT